MGGPSSSGLGWQPACVDGASTPILRRSCTWWLMLQPTASRSATNPIPSSPAAISFSMIWRLTDFLTCRPAIGRTNRPRPSLERFPKRLNLEGFPYGHESDSSFALERRPVWDGEAVFGGFAYARGEGGGGGRHDTGNCGAPRCEYQLCGPLS